MKVAMTLDNQPQHHTNPHPSVTGFQGPISGAHLDNMERTSNHVIIPQTAPARMVPSISPFHIPRAPDQTYIGHALQAYAQTVGAPRDYTMHYGMFRPPTNAVSFDPMVVYKYEGAASNPSFIAPPHALATPVYVPNGKYTHREYIYLHLSIKLLSNGAHVILISRFLLDLAPENSRIIISPAAPFLFFA